MSRDDHRRKIDIPSMQKLETMANVFDMAMTGVEQELYIKYIFGRAMELMGIEDAAVLFEMMKNELRASANEGLDGDDFNWADIIEGDNIH